MAEMNTSCMVAMIKTCKTVEVEQRGQSHADDDCMALTRETRAWPRRVFMEIKSVLVLESRGLSTLEHIDFELS